VTFLPLVMKVHLLKALDFVMVFFSYIDIFSAKKRKNLYMPTNYVQIQREREREREQIKNYRQEIKKNSEQLITYQKLIFKLCQIHQQNLIFNLDVYSKDVDYLKEQ